MQEQAETEEERLDKAFTLRVSSRLYDAILREAKAAKRKPADWMRIVLEERTESSGNAGVRRSS
jgi:predicted HicB family RNase H-like nuclease